MSALLPGILGCANIARQFVRDVAQQESVDISMLATLLYRDGRSAQMSCAMDVANHRHATIVGTQGTIETEYLNHTSESPGKDPRGYLPSLMRMRKGTANTVPFEIRPSPAGSGFRFAAQAFAKVVAAHDTVAIELAAQASLDIAATLEAIEQSARSGNAVELGARGLLP